MKKDKLLTEFNEGGTHEENPIGGIPQGVAPDGKPNSVEEGETKLTVGETKYIFSDRVDTKTSYIDAYTLPSYIKGKSFAEASKLINKKFKDRNDNSSLSTQKALLGRLLEAQEMAKLEASAKEVDMTVPEFLEAKAEAAANAQIKQDEQAIAEQQMEGEQTQGGQPIPQEGEVPQNVDMQPSEGQMAKGGAMPSGAAGGAISGGIGMATSMIGDLSDAKDGEVRDKMSVGGTTAKYALMGAAAGSVVPGIGTAIGGGVGAVAGATLALTSNSKRGGEMQDLAQKQQGKKLMESGYTAAYGGHQYAEGGGLTGRGNEGLDIFDPEYLDESRFDTSNIAEAPNLFDSKEGYSDFKQFEYTPKKAADIDVRNREGSSGFTGGFGGGRFGGAGASGDYEVDRKNNFNDNGFNPYIPLFPDENRGMDFGVNQGGAKGISSMSNTNIENSTPLTRYSPPGEEGNEEGNISNGSYAGYAGLAASTAPFVGNLFEGANLEQDDPTRYARVGRTYKPEFADESSMMNVVDDSYAGLEGAIASATNGNLGAYRANLLGANINKSKARGEAYNRINDINRGEQKNLNEDYAVAARENVSLANREMIEEKQDRAAYDAAKRKYRTAAYEGLGDLGKSIFGVDQMDDMTPYGITGNRKKTV